MDIHHKIQYGVIASVSAVALGAIVHSTSPTITVSSNLSKQLQKITEKHDVNIYCAPGFCDTADQIADQFEIAKWKVNVEPAIAANSGIGVRGPDLLQHVLQESINERIKLEVQKDNNRPWEIWVGKPERKSHS